MISQKDVYLCIILPVICLRLGKHGDYDTEAKILINQMTSLCVFSVWAMASWKSLVRLARKRYDDLYEGYGFCGCSIGMLLGIDEFIRALNDPNLPSRVIFPLVQIFVGMIVIAFYDGDIKRGWGSFKLGLGQLYPPPDDPPSPPPPNSPPGLDSQPPSDEDGDEPPPPPPPIEVKEHKVNVDELAMKFGTTIHGTRRRTSSTNLRDAPSSSGTAGKRNSI